MVVNSLDSTILQSQKLSPRIDDRSSGNSTPVKINPLISARQTIAVARTSSTSPRVQSPLQRGATDGSLKQSTYGGNNELTRNMLRERTVTLLDGKRPKNSLGNDIYSFSELEKKPDGIDKDDLVFHLSDEDFVELFDVTFETFKNWKGWKQQSEKQKSGLW